MKKLIITLFCTITLCMLSCSPQYRFNRLVRKHPEFITRIADTMIFINKDTIYHSDTVITKERRDSFILTHDTVIKTSYGTVYRRGNEFGFQIKGDTTILKDTIYREITVKGKVLKVKEPMNMWGPVAAVIFFLLLLLSMIKKR